MIIDLSRVALPGGWARKPINDDTIVIEADDAAEELAIPLDLTGVHQLHLNFFTHANRRASSMQVRLTSQTIWRRLRPMRFINAHRDAVQPVDAIALDIQPGDALHIRTEPVSRIALAGISLLPVVPSSPPPSSERSVGFVHDTNMSFSKYTINDPDDVYSILQPYVDSHVTHIFFGTGVGTYSPLYESTDFGWHGQEQKEFMATHRARTAKAMQMLKAAGKDPLAMAVEYAHANGLQLWANHRISKNHEVDFRDDYPGGRFMIEHRDKMVREHSGDVHFQTIMSHAYPEIRQATVQMLVDQARYGVDGIYIDFLRKSPIVGWEAKTVEDFEQKHGVNPRETRPDNFTAMWIEHLCSYPTQLLRELRTALQPIERKLGRRMPIAVNVRGGWRFTSGHPGCVIEAQDPVTWAREGLVDIVIPGYDLWLTQQCLDRYMDQMAQTNCAVWGAIGPQTRDAHRSSDERKQYDGEGENDCADTDPWRYLQAAHDFYSQGAPGVAIWESQDIPSVPQVWNTIANRIGSYTELCNTFGDKLGKYDGSDSFERRFV